MWLNLRHREPTERKNIGLFPPIPGSLRTSFELSQTLVFGCGIKSQCNSSEWGVGRAKGKTGGQKYKLPSERADLTREVLDGDYRDQNGFFPPMWAILDPCQPCCPW